MRGRIEASPASKCYLLDDVRREEKLKDIANTITNVNRWSSPCITDSLVVAPDEKPTRDENTVPAYQQGGGPKSQSGQLLRPQSLTIPSTAPAIVSAIVKKIPTGIGSTKSSELSTTSPSPKLKPSQTHERGDPDGDCGVDDAPASYLSKNSELRVNLPSEELLNSKKGWLMKQDSRTTEWSKHWFSLRGAALFYYRDPVAEEKGVLDGVLDVNSITSIAEVPVSRNYGFQLTTWDNRRIVLSTVTISIRNNWINVLKTAAGLSQTKATLNNNNLGLNNQNDENFKTAVTVTTPVTPITPKSMMFSSDEEYRTASEGGRRDSIGDWGSPISPSPPVVPHSAIARTKDRLKSSHNRLHKRSQSSPPSSRRSTIDSVQSEDQLLLHINPVQEEVCIDKELQLRLQAAEKELSMLREETHEREARMSELLATLERTEQELTRKRELEENREKLMLQLDESRNNAQEVIDRVTVELDKSRDTVKELEDRLARGIEENESLYKKIREYGICSPASSLCSLNTRSGKMKRMDSFSDLTSLNEVDPSMLDKDMLTDEYQELRARFEKAVSELKAMKRELKESHKICDDLEISYASLKNETERHQREHEAQSRMMADRIQDMTNKYTNAEKQVRLLRQKLVRNEKRRSLSLKGKESLTIQKELEEKVTELENKIDALEHGVTLVDAAVSPTDTSELKISEHLMDRLKSLEGVVISVRELVNQSMHQFQNLKSSRSRRSVSPIADKKDSFKFVERCLSEVSKLLRDSCDNCVIQDCSLNNNIVLLPDLRTIHARCVEVQKRIDSLIETAKTLQLECDECSKLQESLLQLTDRHEYEELSNNHHKNAEEYVELEKERDFLFEQIKKEKDHVKRLEKRLEMLEAEHAQQVDNLHAAYREQQMANEIDSQKDKEDEDSLRQRYQAEIEQLRALCEKGLAAMESSHRRIIQDQEEKHQHEIARLIVEKEQALAEETQATLAALDAMRKAHQNEVQREVTRFKQEFLQQFQKGGTSPLTYKEKEQELEEVRQEILSLSEKYSMKCVETASIEEKLKIATQQLKYSQQHILQLDVRNKQLRAHFVTGEPSESTSSSTLSKETQHEQAIPCQASAGDSTVIPPSPVPAAISSSSSSSILSSSSGSTAEAQSVREVHIINNKKESHPRLNYCEGAKLGVSPILPTSTTSTGAGLTGTEPPGHSPSISNNRAKVLPSKQLNTMATPCLLGSTIESTTVTTSPPAAAGSYPILSSCISSLSKCNSIRNSSNNNNNNNNDTDSLTELKPATISAMCSPPLLDEKDSQEVGADVEVRAGVRPRRMHRIQQIFSNFYLESEYVKSGIFRELKSSLTSYPASRV
ncbi:outspread [Culex quinquefasciatus]|uniref:Outspread n=1 Tax=Culex quinquefasciatus TaxID=7176 RepID=B0WPH0_CULQU|nr:outspread [Culex quinquefasciatus]|eukprot:XP_001850604.1 outspread [Culex quinquefasciatus]